MTNKISHTNFIIITNKILYIWNRILVTKLDEILLFVKNIGRLGGHCAYWNVRQKQILYDIIYILKIKIQQTSLKNRFTV